ncbi:DUF4244 domain-containing protein [Streptomyces sp. NBC_00386]
MSRTVRVLGLERGRGHGQGQRQQRARLRAWMLASIAARRDAGMVTSEYAVGVIAAVAFAAALYKVVTSGQVGEELQGIVGRALNVQM